MSTASAAEFRSPSKESRAARGWCPGARRPMASGDGLLVRVRPPLGRLEAAQVLALCDAAGRWGSGEIDLTSRANLQLRGVREETWPALLEALDSAGLLDPSEETERLRNILVAPSWEPGDETSRVAAELASLLTEWPAGLALPGKFGFAVDAGGARVLARESADIRAERAISGRLVVRADGRTQGTPVGAGGAAKLMMRLAEWFASSGAAAAGRMRRYGGELPPWAPELEEPAQRTEPPGPGPVPQGFACGVPFGRTRSSVLREALERSGARAVRTTPWRVLIFEGGEPFAVEGLVTQAGWDGRRVDACTGAPGCASATVETRELAARLAEVVAGTVHVSGCAKGCARQAPADLCVTGREGKFDVAFDARAGDPAVISGVGAEELLRRFGAV